MSKKMFKRSLALGALMAFVITGSAMAGDVDVKADDPIYNKEAVIDVGTGTFKNAGTVEAETRITVTGGLFENTGTIKTGTLDIFGNVNDKSEIKGNIEASEAIIYRGIAGNNQKRNLTAILNTPFLHIIGTGNQTGFKVTSNEVLKNVTEIKIEMNNTRGGLAFEGTDLVIKSKIVLAGTKDARLEIENGSKVEFANIEVENSGNKVQTNNTTNVSIRNLEIKNEGVFSLQTLGTYGTDVGNFELANVILGENAELKTAVYDDGYSNTPNAEITGDIVLTMEKGASADFGGMSSANWKGNDINLNANSLTVIVKDTSDKEEMPSVYISDVSEIKNDKITVISNSDNNTGIANVDLAKIAGVVKRTNDADGKEEFASTDNSDTTGVKLIQEASSIYDGAEGSVQADGTAKVEEIIKNSNTYGITENNALSLMSWRAEMNDMNKRMGELRNAEGQHGVWVRMVRGEAEYESVKNQYNQYQIGYDEKLSTDPSWTVGAAFNYTEGDTSYSTGSAENKNTGFSIYGSKLNDDGSFIDLIAKYARLENDFDVLYDGNLCSGDYASNGYSVSAEYGKRFTKENGLWIEPQVELTYGKVGSADYKLGTVDIAQDSIESLVGRVGFSLGKNISKGNVYARASYLYDFDGETTVKFIDGDKPRTMEQDLGGGWWEVGVGANINLSKATYIYADVEKTFGGEVDTNWQWNLGVRYSF